MLELDVGTNQLTGPLQLQTLPDGIQTIRLAGNQFSGEIECIDLPGNLQMLDVVDNPKLSGTIVVRNALLELKVGNTRIKTG